MAIVLEALRLLLRKTEPAIIAVGQPGTLTPPSHSGAEGHTAMACIPQCPRTHSLV